MSFRMLWVFSPLVTKFFFFVVISADDLLVPPHDTNTDLTEVMEQINNTFPACHCKFNKICL